MRPVTRLLLALGDKGLLLTQDKALPNVVGILTGESLRNSRWSHPKAHLIFSVLSELADHPDVLFTKLLYRKDTLVHRSLWPAVLTVGNARNQWQVQGGEPIRGVGAPVKELEGRLLVTTQEIHTESGRHEMALESWQAWSRRVSCPPWIPDAHARKALEDAAFRLGAPLTSLPWPTRARCRLSRGCTGRAKVKSATPRQAPFE